MFKTITVIKETRQKKTTDFETEQNTSEKTEAKDTSGKKVDLQERDAQKERKM